VKLSLGCVGLAAIIGAPISAASPDEDRERSDIVVIAPGGLQDLDDAIEVEWREIQGVGRPNLLQALARNVPGLSLQDAQNNPWQPNLVYRGFTISPLQGQSQGLAVYVDGARFNQPFGDTVQFDLLPEAALERVDLLDANPVYGLNALGGAMVITTKTGNSAPGFRVSGSGGRFGEAEGVAEAGWAGEQASAYLALQERHDGGWRRFSPSTLYNGYADLGWDGRDAGVHVKLLAADSDLTGNGTSPVELLAADRRAVFTYPDNTRNRFGRISVHPYANLSATTRLQASLYVQQLTQRTLNGDAADVEECDDDEAEGVLCLETADGGEESPLIDTNGVIVPDALGGEGYGVLNRSRTRTTAGGALIQLIDTRSLGAGENQLVIGASHDRSRTRFRSSTELGALTYSRSVEGLGPVIAQPDGSIAPVSLHARTRYTGLFLSDRLPLFPNLNAEIGLRWNHARIVLEDQLGDALNGRHKFHRLNPGVELDWAVTPVLSLRGGYAETSRAPTPAELSCADEEAPCSFTNFFLSDPPLRQIVARSWEAGASGGKGQFSWLLSGYRTTSSNDIQFVASETRGRAFFRNIGRTRRQGVEATAAYRGDRLRVSLSYAFTDATYRVPLLLNAPDNPGADEDGRIAVRAGDRLPGIPRHRGTLSGDYIADRWQIGGDVQAASGQYLFGDEANLQPRTGRYIVANLRGSMTLTGPVAIFGEVRNVFNRHFETFGAFAATDEIELDEAPGASDPRSLGPGAPRRWTMGLKVNL
jgi:iron complex outermembrane recepter protein